MKKILLVLTLGAAALIAYQPAGEAAQRGSKAASASEAGNYPRARHRKRATRVRGYLARRVGGYSYAPEDVINTYGNSRTLFGTTNSYRDTFSDRQTPSGPFDHGFFFDSGMGPRGGDSPYPH